MVKNWIRWLLAYFERQHVVESVIAVKLWIYRIHQVVHRHYEARYGNFEQLFASTRSPDGTEDGGYRWDWRGLPRVWTTMIYYDTFTTFYYVFVMLKNVVPSFLESLLGCLPLPMEPHCYLLGNFISHELLEPQVVILFVTLHLSWRSIIHIFKRPYMFSLYVFLSMTDHDLERFYELIKAQEAGSVIDSASKRDLACQHMNESRRLSHNALQLNELQVSLRISGPPEGQEADANARVERLFKQALCYKIERFSVTYYKLKPNRTPEARKILRRHLALLTLIVTTLYLTSLVIIQAYMSTQLLDLRRYVRKYPACGHNLTDERSIIDGASLSFSWHHAVSVVWDFFESTILWTESGYAVLVCWASTYFLNYDNELYCSKLSKKLNGIYGRIEGEHRARRFAGLELRAKLTSLTKLTDSGHHDSEILELLVEFYDFLRQIQDTDLIVSDIIPFTIGIWVSLFVVIGESASVRKHEFQDPAFIVLAIFLGAFTYITVTIGCFSLLRLHRHCQRDYKTVCSMMALDTSCRVQGLPRLIEFLTVSRRSSYTIFRQYPFTSTTYLSILGWSFSCFFVLDSILTR